MSPPGRPQVETRNVQHEDTSAGAHAIVLADDHAVVRAGYRRLLELEPELTVVAEFADAEAAYLGLTQAALRDIALLVLDLSMPGCGGLVMLRRLRQRLPALKVLVFTMHDSTTLMARCRDAGASGYVTKNSEPALLVAAVRAALAGKPVWPDALRRRRAQRRAARTAVGARVRCAATPDRRARRRADRAHAAPEPQDRGQLPDAGAAKARHRHRDRAAALRARAWPDCGPIDLPQRAIERPHSGFSDDEIATAACTRPCA